MMRRRDVLRLLSLSTFAVAGGTALAGCGPDGGGGSEGGTTGGGGGASATDVELVAADVARAPGDPAAIAPMVAAMHTTGGALFGSVGAEPGDLTLSPFSVLVAMALAGNGARGTTATEILGLYGDADQPAVNDGLNALTAHVEGLAGQVENVYGKSAELVLDVANALFGQRGLTWGEPYLQTLAAEYGAGMNTVDWAGDTAAARGSVNAWTAERTRDKIPEILGENDVSADTRLVLVNTLYLKAPWDAPFEPELTEPAPFTTLDGDEVEVPMMAGGSPRSLPAGSGEGWTAVTLPYAGQTTAMTVVLPDADRFADVEAEVVAGGLPAMLEALRPSMVDVALPRFTFRSRVQLGGPLEGLGVRTAFTDDADFSGMTTEEDLAISKVVHEVFVAVDEEGTEAAAATAVVVVAQSAPVVDLTFRADRPFLFFIHDVEHHTPLFLGRVTTADAFTDA